MKPSQVLNRLIIRLGKGAFLGVCPAQEYSIVQPIKSIEILDFDPVFLARFPLEELMNNTITVLHTSKKMNWDKTWNFEDKSALWNFNLHYFDFIFPLVKAWKDTGEDTYLLKTEEMIIGWIKSNPKGQKPAWSSYTTALRIVNWITYYGYVCDSISEEFRENLLSSIHSQYVYLSSHLEKDILGNHYFEDLKSLVLASLFFNDSKVFTKALNEFKHECAEEILDDGMHFEFSPMYHKIIFEGMLKIAVALRNCGKKDGFIEGYLQPMLNVAYSFEYGLDRVPLFNDGGNNVAKSLDALVLASNSCFSLKPKNLSILKSSGFCIFDKTIDNKKWKLILDAGNPGPRYNPGHAHCDALSYELFCDGKPIIVNCGTYDYQCKERSFFRSTKAHNTVMINGMEQSQCWSDFRMAKRCEVKIIKYDNNSVTVEMIDAQHASCVRKVSFYDSYLEIEDCAPGNELEVFIHMLLPVKIECNANRKEIKQPYAYDYGEKTTVLCYSYKAQNKIKHIINLDNI